MRICWILIPLLLAGACSSRLGTPDDFKAEALWESMVTPEALEAAPAPAPGPTVPELLDLTSAVRIALAENPTLRTAFMRVEAARARVAGAVSSYMPSVDAVYGYQKTFETSQDRSVPGVNQEAEYHSYGLRASWLIFDGLARTYRLRAARRGVEEREASHDDARRLLQLAVEAAFFDTLGGEELIRIARADLEFERELQQETSKRYRAGDRSLSDKLNFDVRVQTAIAALIATESLLATRRLALAELLGIEGGVLPERVTLDRPPEGEFMKRAPADAEALVREGLRNRPDLGGASAAVSRTEAEIGAVNGRWLPEVAMVGEVSRQSIGDFHTNSRDTASYLGLEATWNLFSGGMRLASHREALANKRAAEADLAQVRNRVIREVREALVLVTNARRRLETQIEKERLTLQTRDLVRKEYDAGEESLVRLNETQRDYIVSQAQVVAERVALATAWSRLNSAVGR